MPVIEKDFLQKLQNDSSELLTALIDLQSGESSNLTDEENDSLEFCLSAMDDVVEYINKIKV